MSANLWATIRRVARFWSIRSARLLVTLDRLLTTDFCPGANRYVYWLKQPIGWFLCAGVMSVLVGCFIGPQGFVLAAAIGMVTGLGVLWPWIAVAGARCEMTFPSRRAREGDAVRVRLRVHNRLPWPIWGLYVQRGFTAEGRGEDADRLVVALARVPGWSTSDFLWEFQPPVRGVYPRHPPAVSSGFPFGIWTARRELELSNQLLVWPRTVDLTSIPAARGDRSWAAAAASRHAGDEDDFLGVRPYRQGDSLRRVHWAQTARHDRLVICERQGAARRTLRIIVDAHPSTHFGSGSDSSLEWAIRVGASLAELFHRHHCNVDFEVGNLRAHVMPARGSLRGFLDQLARFRCERDGTSIPPPAGGGPAEKRSGPRGTARDRHLPTILVATDRWVREAHVNAAVDPNTRLIILSATSLDSQEMPARLGSPSWIQLDDLNTVCTQFRRKWEEERHASWPIV